ncbi:MAG: hypothetical protein IJ892_04295 [Prevotella sp.]|nr:hypothetical protein [Prevotella sp.]
MRPMPDSPDFPDYPEFPKSPESPDFPECPSRPKIWWRFFKIWWRFLKIPGPGIFRGSAPAATFMPPCLATATKTIAFVAPFRALSCTFVSEKYYFYYNYYTEYKNKSKRNIRGSLHAKICVPLQCEKKEGHETLLLTARCPNA